MVWPGEAWAWRGLKRCGVVWRGEALLGEAWHGEAWRDVA